MIITVNGEIKVILQDVHSDQLRMLLLGRHQPLVAPTLVETQTPNQGRRYAPRYLRSCHEYTFPRSSKVS
jgi:hypothetical protein